MSEDSDNSRDHADLEALLKGLKPGRLDVHQFSELNRTRERTLMEHEFRPTRMQWSRVVPVMLACFVVMFGVALFRYGALLRQQSPEVASTEPVTVVESLAAESLVADAAAPEPPVPVPAPRFLPVSAHGTVVKTSSGGVVETEAGPRERVQVEYQDAYHWHDPETGTNIRIFQPRNEEIVVPFVTD